MKKIRVVIGVMLLILLSLIILKPQFHKKYYGDSEDLIKKALSSRVKTSTPEMFKIIDSIIEDDYKFVGYSYNNGIGVAQFKKKNNKFEFHSSKWCGDVNLNNFTLHYGDRLSNFKYILIFPKGNKDISKIKLTVNEKTFEKQVNLNKPSMIDFDVNFSEFNTDSYKFKHEYFDSDDNLIELK